MLRSFTLEQNENSQLKAAAEAATAETAALRQQLADAQSKLAAPAAPTPAPAASTEDPVELQRRLTDAESKLATSLRRLRGRLRRERCPQGGGHAKGDASIAAVAAVETRAAASAATQATQLAEVRDQLRQVQAQSAVYAEENFQLRTRLAFRRWRGPRAQSFP